MGRTPRFDGADSWHHVMNRAIARRTLFETRDDIRFFLSRVARAVHRGQIEVHAFCVLATHFHLLARSLIGELSQALQMIQNEYVRRFNRRRRRDGSLVRGRFRSKPVNSLRYRKALVAYIDHNPVSARIVPSADLYPHGSARRYAGAAGPPWLSREWIETCIREQVGDRIEVQRGYHQVFGSPPPPGVQRLIERRLTLGSGPEDPLDELYTAAAPGVREWMQGRARLADGTQAGIALVDLESVEETVRAREATLGPWPVFPGRRALDGWSLARVGLWRDLCASTFDEAARRSGSNVQWVWSRHRQHRGLLLADEDYAARVGELARAALTACWDRSR